ncbi:hypothetical protein BSL78_15748 [Apostichopus japonicus]|uniref:Uncharacterized protein n=1 Tax=Stichopus japonicus TaxID=307972 RepID=A0A2G8KHB2_STIJA|nr:hypothetical protein BSL78_15748 [Apostichopus japonicus]
MLITLLGWEDALTKLFTIGTSVLFLSLHVKFSPMKSPFEQHLQLFSLIAIFQLSGSSSSCGRSVPSNPVHIAHITRRWHRSCCSR